LKAVRARECLLSFLRKTFAFQFQRSKYTELGKPYGKQPDGIPRHNCDEMDLKGI
jgi:hypothetical protein